MVKHYCDKCGKEAPLYVRVTTGLFGDAYNSLVDVTAMIAEQTAHDEDKEFCRACWKEMKPWNS